MKNNFKIRLLWFMSFIMIVSIFLTLFSINAFAIDDGVSTEEMSEDDIINFIENTNISISTEEPPKKSIECFDVNEHGIIAIGNSNFGNKTVCLYSNNGEFLRCYKFKCSGSFAVELDPNDNLYIYYVRSSVSLLISPENEITVKKIQDTSENNSYWNNHIYSSKRTIGDTEYVIKNDMGILNYFQASYSQLVKRAPSGEETVLYDVSSDQLIGFIAIVGFAVVLVVLIGAIVYHSFKSKQEEI